MKPFIQQLCFLLVSLALGCAATSSSRLYSFGPAVNQSHVQLLEITGVGGATPEERNMLTALRSSGFNGSLQLYDWTGGEPTLVAYRDRKRQTAETQRTAEMLISMRRADPRARITLTGHSAGAGIAIWALERLPRDVQVDQVVLFAPALSPTYDLRPALDHVRGKMIVFPSDHDALVLGIATTLFGTIDGVHSHAAGLEGFTPPAGAELAYQRVVQHSYDPAWQCLGDDGGHSGAMAPEFVTVVLCPILNHPNDEHALFASTAGPARNLRQPRLTATELK
jgi:pimeloyl-ACP methyl ester carboxylesterase